MTRRTDPLDTSLEPDELKGCAGAVVALLIAATLAALAVLLAAR